MAIIFEVKVIPCSGKQEWKLDKSNILKCYLKSLPENGKANAELIKYTATCLGVSQAMVSIVSGNQSRRKKIKIEIEISYERLLELLGIQLQMTMFDT